jgi:signal transduction histidine kinase
VAFFRTVDVLISLHHKVSYLSRNKPHLLKELEHAQEELLFINTAAFNFLEQFAQEVHQIEPINFAAFDQRKKSQLSEHFVQLRHFLSKLAEIVIGQDEYHRQVYEKTERLIDLVVLFSKVLAGENEFVEEWEEMIAALQQESEQPVSEEEGRLIAILEECLDIQRARAGGAGVQREESAAKTNEELEDEVNKLIEDYERLKGENRQLGENL